MKMQKLGGPGKLKMANVNFPRLDDLVRTTVIYLFQVSAPS